MQKRQVILRSLLIVATPKRERLFPGRECEADWFCVREREIDWFCVHEREIHWFCVRESEVGWFCSVSDITVERCAGTSKTREREKERLVVGGGRERLLLCCTWYCYGVLRR